VVGGATGRTGGRVVGGVGVVEVVTGFVGVLFVALGTVVVGDLVARGSVVGGMTRVGGGTLTLVVLVVADAFPPARATMTSWWATTGAGRSVTSAATTDTAVHTMRVAATVRTSQIPVAK